MFLRPRFDSILFRKTRNVKLPTLQHKSIFISQAECYADIMSTLTREE